MSRDPVSYPDPIGVIERPDYEQAELGWVEWGFDVLLHLLANTIALAAQGVVALVRTVLR